MAMKLTPLDKQSKRRRREFHAARRGSWNGLSPVTRIVPDRRAYDRNRMKRETAQSAEKQNPY